MHAAYSTMLRHIRHREDAYQAILRSINCLTTTEKALHSGSRSCQGRQPFPFGQLWRKQIRLIFLSFKLTSLKAFTLNLPAFLRKEGSFFKIKKLQKNTPT